MDLSMKQLIFHLMLVQPKLFSMINLVITKLLIFLIEIIFKMNQLEIMLIFGHSV
jgi:hypothetical protein